MTPSQLSSYLVAAFQSRKRVLITSEPGVGKTAIVHQAADLVHAEMMTSHPAVEDPTDAKGFPWVVDGRADFLPFGHLRRAIEFVATDLVPLLIWFLDDFGQGTAAVQSAYMQLLHGGQINGHQISPDVVFCAATNRRTDRAGVTGILEPVKSRFNGGIVSLEAHLEDFCAWAVTHGINPIIVAFLRFRSDLLSAFTPTADLKNCPSPRTWEFASEIFNMNLPATIKHEALAGVLGEGAATEVMAFETMYLSMPDVDQIIVKPDTAPIPDKSAILYAVSTALGYRASKDNFDKIAVYLDRLVQHDKGEFAALTLQDAQHKHPEIVKTVPYVKLIAGPMGQLLSGR